MTNPAQLINDLQILGQDQDNNWVLGLVTLKIKDDHYEALYSEYKHGQKSSYFSREYNGKVINDGDSLSLEGFAQFLPHEGFTTIGELFLTTRAPFIKNLRTISMKLTNQSHFLKIKLKKNGFLG